MKGMYPMASSTWPIHVDPAHLYFITMSAVARAQIFKRDVIKRILVDALNTGRILGRFELFAFVIMPNHMHWIIRCGEGQTPATIVRDYKKATDFLIIRHYQMERATAALDFLSAAAPIGQEYAVWQDEFQAKNVFSPEFLREKLTYIHHNPLQPHWQLAGAPDLYIWSSARYYSGDGQSLIPLSDARSLL
jgi:REP element-mobilizing transposase RayT